MAQYVPTLKDVPETMLWPLYQRAVESRRADGVLHDPHSIKILEGLDYDFPGHFGTPTGALAARAASIDKVLMAWLKINPDGLVISLGEGLETQARRVDNGQMRWLSVDLPESIRLRERFLPPTDRFHHLPMSALDPEWMAAVDPAQPIFIVAQGLLMYLAPTMVENLVAGAASRFPGAEFAFDTIPPWLSQMTVRGLYLTPTYRLPDMPWGIECSRIEPVLRRWCGDIGEVELLSYQTPRGVLSIMNEFMLSTPQFRDTLPALVLTRFSPARRHPGIFRDFLRADGLTWTTVQLDEGGTIPDLEP